MVDCVVDRGWTIEQTAERFQVDAKTVRKVARPVPRRRRRLVVRPVITTTSLTELDTRRLPASDR
jgi:hypothetical protein